MDFLNNRITSETEVKLFVDGLAAENSIFHFDDDPRDVLGLDRRGLTKEAFTEQECILIDLRINEIESLDLIEYLFDYTLDNYLNY